MGKRRSSVAAYRNTREQLEGFSFDRVIMPSRSDSHGGNITVIFRHHASGAEKPVPYPTVNKMVEQVRTALQRGRQIKRRDKSGSDCDDVLLSKLLAAKKAADRRRHTVRRHACA